MTPPVNKASQPVACRKPFLAVLEGEARKIPPIWLMRQAGRYLPEYRDVRAGAGSFLNLCYTPKLAAEVTLQPIRRFGFDAAILFSDILVVPDALGQEVRFEEGEGPRLSPVLNSESIARIGPLNLDRLSPVFETIERVKGGLPKETALIGFCGAPWTVASYMIAGQGTRDLEPVRLFAYRQPEAFGSLIEKLVDASVDYLCEQWKAGVEAVQIFDSWAGLAPSDQFDAWCVRPVVRMLESLRARAPGLKLIAFPREAGSNLKRFVETAAPDCIGLGVTENVREARRVIGGKCALQGNLDPLALLAGGEALDASVRRILSEFDGARHIFNLGHGILPSTPIVHVERLLKLVRG
jgi:uroporphyrinogen decarboxylase